jgi:hypothetical protein
VTCPSAGALMQLLVDSSLVVRHGCWAGTAIQIQFQIQFQIRARQTAISNTEFRIQIQIRGERSGRPRASPLPKFEFEIQNSEFEIAVDLFSNLKLN